MPSQSTRGYYVVRASDSYLLDYYELKPVSNISASSVSAYSIIGDDDRYLENGLKGVVALGSGGTAFVVDKHTILTAAHCICKDRSSTLNCYQNIKIDVYKDNCTIEKSLTPVQYHIPSNFIDLDENLKDSEGNVLYKNYDYAIITVEQDLTNYINFSLGSVRNEVISSTKIGPDVYATGFPCLYKGNLTEEQRKKLLAQYPNINLDLAQGQKVTGEGKFKMTNSALGTDVFRFTADILPGNSGSPVYIDDNDIKTAVGICIQQFNGYNVAIRIDTDILHFVYNNNNLSY